MKKLIWYLRSCFCKHDWVIKEEPYRIYDPLEAEERGIFVHMICKKCGWHQSYKKFKF